MDSCAYAIGYNVLYKRIKMENDSINKINKIRVKETKL